MEKIQKVKIQKPQNNAQSKCAMCESKKNLKKKIKKFIKEQEASGLLSSLAIKTPLSKIHLVDPVLF